MCGIVANCIIVTRDVVIFMWDDTVNEGLLAHQEICNPLGVDEYCILYNSVCYLIIYYRTKVFDFPNHFAVLQTCILTRVHGRGGRSWRIMLKIMQCQQFLEM